MSGLSFGLIEYQLRLQTASKAKNKKKWLWHCIPKQRLIRHRVGIFTERNKIMLSPTSKALCQVADVRRLCISYVDVNIRLTAVPVWLFAKYRWNAEAHRTITFIHTITTNKTYFKEPFARVFNKCIHNCPVLTCRLQEQFNRAQITNKHVVYIQRTNVNNGSNDMQAT